MRQTPAAYFRIRVTTGGCSGLSYVFDLVENTEPDDKIYEFENVKVCIDRKSILVLKGTEIDYIDTLMTSGFKLTNPASTHTCGCGESFSI